MQTSNNQRANTALPLHSAQRAANKHAIADPHRPSEALPERTSGSHRHSATMGVDAATENASPQNTSSPIAQATNAQRHHTTHAHTHGTFESPTSGQSNTAGTSSNQSPNHNSTSSEHHTAGNSRQQNNADQQTSPSNSREAQLETLKSKLAELFEHVVHAWIYIDRSGSSDTLKISDIRRTLKNMRILDDSCVDTAIDEALGPLWKSEVIDVKRFIRKFAWHPIPDLSDALSLCEQSKIYTQKIVATVAAKLVELRQLQKKKTGDMDGILAHVCGMVERHWISVSLAYTRFNPQPPEGLPRGVLARVLRGNVNSVPMAWQRKAMGPKQFKSALEEQDVCLSHVQVCV